MPIDQEQAQKSASSTQPTRRMRGELRRAAIVEAAAQIIREEGPVAVTHRAVARRCGCSLSATTYYFSGLDELLAEAGKVNIRLWARRAERVASEVERSDVPESRDEIIDIILRACLPPTDALENHYLQLLEAARAKPVARAYAVGRTHLDAAIARVLARVGLDVSPQLIVAIVDGAAVSALSEGRDVRELARQLLKQIA
ncbi:MAG: TetR family transcriptional regulator [Actinomycetaceae bacterium]|nr:TetR family transcriptional regulator [Actinomycetaceae bacterium]